MKFYDGFAVVKSLGWLSLGDPFLPDDIFIGYVG
jgi:hypothetical protein